MKLNNTVVTLALVGVLALAALAGGLIPLGNVAHAVEPEFVTGADTRSIPENTPPGVNIGAPISATDADEGTEEFGQTLTYKLGGTDAALFDIDSSTGQLITKAPLDTEASATHSVTVTVDDGETRPADSPCTACTVTVTITVTDDTDEEPLAPIPPTVVSGPDDGDTDPDESTTSLKVVWHPPDNAGRPPLSAYEVVYKESTATNFSEAGATNVTVTAFPATTATITGLEADTSYDVRVRATNTDGMGLWSLVGTGSTNKENNSAPSFNDEDSLVTRDVDENTPAGENVDGPVTATDADTTTLTYGIEGPHADLFSFDTRSGQIRTKASLNHEDTRCGYVEPDDPATATTTCTYRVTVTVVDRAGGSDATRVHIEVDERVEPPSAPGRPTVRATEDSSTSLDVSWSAPANTGPPITSYTVQYRKGSEAFSADGVTVTGTTATISGTDPASGTDPPTPWLAPNTSYEVRVRATNAERASDWSASGTGRTNRANHQPIFDERPHTGTGSDRGSALTVSRRVDENPRSGQVVGRVFADDADNDRLTYRIVASADTDEARAEAAMFDIDERTGQIRTKAGVTYNYEALAASGTCDPLTDTDRIGSDRCLTLTVEVRDGRDDDRVEVEEADPDDSITVKIGVRDRDEPPAVPTVTVTSPTLNTTLAVFWDARNTGPAITHYDLQYRKGGGTFSDDNCDETESDDNCTRLDDDTTTDNATRISATTIVGLEEDTSYSVQVRATNAEGTSAWSRVVTVKTNKDREDPDETNAPPVITTPTLAVDENTPSGRDVGTAVTATDDSSTSLAYSLGGRDAALFTIVAGTGQIRTRSSLNHEDAECGYVSTADPTVCTYTVRVRVDDRAGGSASVELPITVNDVDEPPSAPGAPRVTATKDTGWSLDVTWNAPRDTGKPPITDYDIRYREFKASNPDDWALWPHGTDDAGNTDRKTEIERRLPGDDADPLKPRTQYEVQVRAKNEEGDATENWSSVGRGTTGPSNSRPSFDRADAVIELRVDENTRAGQNVGSAVSASDADSNGLRYSLEGPGKDSFTILSSSGQIRTRSPLDFETRQSYSLTVKVDDGQKRKNSVAAKSVTITVDNVTEQPSAPAAPRVAGIPGSTDSVRVTWDEPANTGPSVTHYEVHYREAGAGTGFLRWIHFGVDRSTIITGLKAGTRYEVQVRARTSEGTSEWSRSGSGMPNPDVANRNPAFTGAPRSLSVAENTPPGTDVGAPIAATDRDGDVLTYTLEGADADSFDILSTSDGGQIQTSAALNHEEKASYAVTVRVRDGRGGTDAVNITISVTDLNNEAPDTPFAPRVTAVSSTRLQVSWEAPANAGPPITDYDYRYREPGGSWTEVTKTAITATAVTIEGLAASTSYDVEVRATNAEGTSDWSNPGIGATNAPGANNPPVFEEGATATRSVSASAEAGASIGEPIEATDADSGDTLTYGLEGRDAPFFDINDTSGQLLTRSGISLIVGDTYTVIVTADDGSDVARITVEIEATAAPPNNPPVFSEGATATRSVRDDAASGANIGNPVRATDADTGDTVTYSLEGTDAASFSIVSTSGQIQTSAALDASTKSTYSVTVRATDSRGGSATIDVTITVTARPTTFGCATQGAVSDTSNTGLVADCEALLAARNVLEGSTGRLNWSASRSIDQWDGVYLRGTPSRVTFLILRREGLDGSVPADLGSLSMLRVLNLHSNALTGQIPSEIGNLTNLEQLLLHNNSLSGDFPDLSRLSRLKKLWLSGRNNRIGEGDGIPTWLNGLTSLEELNLWGNEMGGTIPNLSGLRNLKLLKLQYNNLTGGIPTWFGNMNSLGGLYLHRNALTGSIPSELGQLTRLRRLWLDRNQLTGTIPPELGNMSNLGTLNLHTNQLSGAIPTQLANLSRLQHFSLHNNQLTGTIPAGLGNLSELTRLAVSNNRLTGTIPASLGGLNKLELLWLSQNQLTGSIPTQLGNLGDTLTNIKLAQNSFDANACVPRGLANVRTNDYSEAGLSICP